MATTAAAAAAPTACVRGELLTVDAAASPAALATYLALLEELDALEEYYGPGDARNVYERVARDVVVVGAAAAAGDDAPHPRDGGGRLGGGDDAAAADPPAAESAAPPGVHAAGAAVGASVRAWVYVAQFDRAAAGGVRVPHGDWRRFMSERALVDAGDDWAAMLVAKRAAAAAAQGGAAS